MNRRFKDIDMRFIGHVISWITCHMKSFKILSAIENKIKVFFKLHLIEN